MENNKNFIEDNQNTDDELKILYDARKRLNEKDNEKKTFEEAAKEAIKIVNSRHISEEKLLKIKKVENKSIGNTRRTKDTGRKKTEKKKGQGLKTIAIILLTAALIGGISYTANVSYEAGYNQGYSDKTLWIDRETKNAEESLIKYTKVLLANNDLAELDLETGEFNLKENSIDDYKRLNIAAPTRDEINRNDNLDNREHLILYGLQKVFETEAEKDLNYFEKQKLNGYNTKEFSKLIKAVSYDNGFSYYEDANNFFILGGYHNNVNPYSQIFENHMEGCFKDYQEELHAQYDIMTQNLVNKQSVSLKGGK